MGGWWCLLALACRWGEPAGCPAFVSWLSVWKTASGGRGVVRISQTMSAPHAYQVADRARVMPAKPDAQTP